MGQDNPDLLGEATAAVETISSKVLTQYAVLGRYDFVIITEAADNQSAARLSLELSVRAGVEHRNAASHAGRRPLRRRAHQHAQGRGRRHESPRRAG